MTDEQYAIKVIRAINAYFGKPEYEHDMPASMRVQYTVDGCMVQIGGQSWTKPTFRECIDEAKRWICKCAADDVTDSRAQLDRNMKRANDLEAALS